MTRYVRGIPSKVYEESVARTARVRARFLWDTEKKEDDDWDGITDRTTTLISEYLGYDGDVKDFEPDCEGYDVTFAVFESGMLYTPANGSESTTCWEKADLDVYLKEIGRITDAHVKKYSF